MKKLFKVTLILKGSGKQLQYTYYALCDSRGIQSVTMSSSFTSLDLDYISCLLCNKKYYSKFTSLVIFPTYLNNTVKYKFVL